MTDPSGPPQHTAPNYIVACGESPPVPSDGNSVPEVADLCRHTATSYSARDNAALSTGSRERGTRWLSTHRPLSIDWVRYRRGGNREGAFRSGRAEGSALMTGMQPFHQNLSGIVLFVYVRPVSREPVSGVPGAGSFAIGGFANHYSNPGAHTAVRTGKACGEYLFDCALVRTVQQAQPLARARPPTMASACRSWVGRCTGPPRWE